MASSTTQWVLELVDKITAPLRSATEAARIMTERVDETTESVGKLGKQAAESGNMLEKFGKGMFFMNEIKDGVDNVTGAFDNAIQPGVNFQYAMAQVQAISGIAGEQFDLVSDKARNLAKTFGVDAAQGTRVFSNILSQLGPDMAEFPNVLDSMARNAMTLSKTMDGDVNGAVSALTASFNSFTPPLNDAIQSAKLMEEQMNIIAKSAQVGAAEVPDLVQSLKNIGPSAKNAGVSFAETNAILQVLGQNQTKAAEAGTALRNAMVILAAPSNDAAKALQAAGIDIETMSNQTIPFADRLEVLKPVMNDTALMARLFGRENYVAGQILVGNTDKIREWTEEVQGSTSATDQAAIMMDTYAEKQRRMDAWIDDLKISFFEMAEPIAPIIKIIGIATTAIVTMGMVAFSATNLMQIGIVKTSLTWVTSMSKIAISAIMSSKLITTSILGIPIIGWIAGVITAITGLVAYFYNTSEKFREFLFGLWELIKTAFTEYYRFIWNVVKAIVEVINPLNWFDDDFSFQGVWDRLVAETEAGARRVGEAWEKGKEKGRESWNNRNKTEGDSVLSLEPQAQTLNRPSELTPGKVNGSSPSGQSVGLGGSKGADKVRNITMNVTMNNQFSLSGEQDYQRISRRIKQELIAIMTDATPTIS